MLTTWSTVLVSRLNNRFLSYRIEGRHAELEDGSKGEKINIRFPKFSTDINSYQLDHILLEFGGRNRGRPTAPIALTCYLAEIIELSPISFPTVKVDAYDPAYILWEKLTALHQFCTQTKATNPNRLSRHWYDVDCLLQQNFADPIISKQAMLDVVKMKKCQWPALGVTARPSPSPSPKKLYPEDRAIIEAAEEESDISREALNTLLNPEKLTRGGL